MHHVSSARPSSRFGKRAKLLRPLIAMAHIVWFSSCDRIVSQADQAQRRGSAGIEQLFQKLIIHFLMGLQNFSSSSLRTAGVCVWASCWRMEPTMPGSACSHQQVIVMHRQRFRRPCRDESLLGAPGGQIFHDLDRQDLSVRQKRASSLNIGSDRCPDGETNPRPAMLAIPNERFADRPSGRRGLDR